MEDKLTEARRILTQGNPSLDRQLQALINSAVREELETTLLDVKKVLDIRADVGKSLADKLKARLKALKGKEQENE